MSSILQLKPFILVPLLGKLISQIKTPFFSKQYFDYSYLIINDPSSFVPKNVTPNCTMIDLILAYFKGVSSYLDELCTSLTVELTSMDDKLKDTQIEDIMRDRMKLMGEENIMVKIFSLKSIEECEKEANI